MSTSMTFCRIFKILKCRFFFKKVHHGALAPNGHFGGPGPSVSLNKKNRQILILFNKSLFHQLSGCSAAALLLMPHMLVLGSIPTITNFAFSQLYLQANVRLSGLALGWLGSLQVGSTPHVRLIIRLVLRGRGPKQGSPNQSITQSHHTRHAGSNPPICAPAMSFRDESGGEDARTSSASDLRKPFLHTGSWYRMSSAAGGAMDRLGSSAYALRGTWCCWRWPWRRSGEAAPSVISSWK